MALGQSNGQRGESFPAELDGEAFGGLWTAAIGVGIESEIDGSGAATQLSERMGIELSSQPASHVGKSRLPQGCIIEKTFDQNHGGVLTGALPAI